MHAEDTPKIQRLERELRQAGLTVEWEIIRTPTLPLSFRLILSCGDLWCKAWSGNDDYALLSAGYQDFEALKGGLDTWLSDEDAPVSD